MTSKFRIASILLASLCYIIGAPSLSLAADEHGHEHKHEESKSHDDAKALGSVKEAWSLLTAKIAEADQHVAAGKLDLIEPVSHDLESVVKTLTEKSDMVEDGKKANLASAIKQLDKSVEAMHHAAEEKDAAGAGSEAKKIKGLMPLIEGLYPAGALK